jgi:hypothetical protein
MSVFSFMAKLVRGSGGRKGVSARKASAVRLRLEALEDRCLPAVTLFPIPSPNTEPEGITRGPDGNLYFAEIHAIGRITPDGQITEFRQGLSPDSEAVRRRRHCNRRSRPPWSGRPRR